MKQFETVPIKKPALNVFNLSHDVKATYNFDKIYPFLCHPVNPGETFNVRAEVFMRTMPLLAPVMHNVDMFLYFFFVPNRLLWNAKRKEDWKTFITGGEKGDFGDHGYKDNPSADFVLPHFNYAQFIGSPQLCEEKSLLDYMGFPTKRSSDSRNISSSKTEPISSLPFRAYQCVWNEYFRNQNLQNEIEFSYDSGLETGANIAKLFVLRKKCWEKDYFTSCLPFQQRGEAVMLPIGSTLDFTMSANGSTEVNKIAKRVGALDQLYDLQLLEGSSPDQGYLGSNATAPAQVAENVKLVGTTSVSSGTISFTGAGIGTITDFRYCLRLQQWLENNARCGSRYIEQILAHFGVMSSDSRLQRPELLGGGKIPLLFSDVPQTSADAETPDGVNSVQGNLAGKGLLYGKTGGFRKYFEEHGILLGLCCIIPRTSYCQGIPRYWRAMDKTDFYFPEFAHLSEQAVLNSEIYYNPVEGAAAAPDVGPDGVFGYQGRFVEYRYIPSTVHGELRTSLQQWHLASLYSQLPRLNASFVEANTRANVWAIEDIAAGDDDPFVAQIHLDVKAVRPMPKFAVPSL